MIWHFCHFYWFQIDCDAQCGYNLLINLILFLPMWMKNSNNDWIRFGFHQNETLNSNNIFKLETSKIYNKPYKYGWVKMKSGMTFVTAKMMKRKIYNILKINCHRAIIAIAHHIYLYYKFVSTQNQFDQTPKVLPIATNPHFLFALVSTSNQRHTNWMFQFNTLASRNSVAVCAIRSSNHDASTIF